MIANSVTSLNVSIVVLVLMISLFVVAGKCKVIPKIFNGYPDTDNIFDYVVCIELKSGNNYMRHCTGSLIDEQWVLTAGHCIGNKTLSVSYGNRSQENIRRVAVLRQIRYPDYRQQELPDNHQKSEILNDIGLLKVERIPITSLGKFSLVNYIAFKGLPVIYAGYGITWQEHENMMSFEYKEKFSELELTPLLLADGVIVTCNITINWQPITCVTSEFSFSGMGDSGGPLLYDNTIIGVHSGYFDQVLVFVPVHCYLKWIRDVKAKYTLWSVV